MGWCWSIAVKNNVKVNVYRKAFLISGRLHCNPEGWAMQGICCPALDIKLLNVLGLSSIIKKKDNLIQSLTGKVDYLKEQLKKKDEE